MKNKKIIVVAAITVIIVTVIAFALLTLQRLKHVGFLTT